METEDKKSVEPEVKGSRFGGIIDNGNLKEPAIWVRLFLMVLYFVILNTLLPVVGIFAFVQFLFVLFSSKRSLPMVQVNKWVLGFYKDSLEFITYQSEEKPFPFNVETSHPVDLESGEAQLKNT